MLRLEIFLRGGGTRSYEDRQNKSENIDRRGREAGERGEEKVWERQGGAGEPGRS